MRKASVVAFLLVTLRVPSAHAQDDPTDAPPAEPPPPPPPLAPTDTPPPTPTPSPSAPASSVDVAPSTESLAILGDASAVGGISSAASSGNGGLAVEYVFDRFGVFVSLNANTSQTFIGKSPKDFGQTIVTPGSGYANTVADLRYQIAGIFRLRARAVAAYATWEIDTPNPTDPTKSLAQKSDGLFTYAYQLNASLFGELSKPTLLSPKATYVALGLDFGMSGRGVDGDTAFVRQALGCGCFNSNGWQADGSLFVGNLRGIVSLGKTAAFGGTIPATDKAFFTVTLGVRGDLVRIK